MMNLNRITLTLVLVFNACGGEEPDFFGENGEAVYMNGFWAQEDVHNTEVTTGLDVWTRALAEEGIECPQIRDEWPSIDVQMAPYPFRDERTGVLLGGQYWPNDKIILGYVSDMTKMAYGHEIGHFVLHICGLPWRHDYCRKAGGGCTPEELWDAHKEWETKYPYLRY